MGYTVFEMGSLRLDGIIQGVCGDDVMYDGQAKISIDNSSPLCQLTWIKPDGLDLLVSNRVILKNVSWGTLACINNEYANGRKIEIDGFPFFCQMPKVGESPEEDSEWKQILTATGDSSDKLWHWKNSFFWGRESQVYNTISDRPLCGGTSATHWSRELMLKAFPQVGFRPMLKPLPFTYNKKKHGKLLNLDGEMFVCAREEGRGENMFCPILIPIKKHTKEGQFCLNLDVFASKKGIENIKMYTLLLNGKPVPQGTRYPLAYQKGAKIEITDIFYGTEYLIPWRVGSGYANVSSPVLYQILKEELDKQEFTSNPYK